MNTINEKLAVFLDKNVSPEDLAKFLRCYNYEIIKMILNDKDGNFCKEFMADGHYFVTELCEILDPQLHLEE